jgi:DNA-binding GntR family transcriptional regulator
MRLEFQRNARALIVKQSTPLTHRAYQHIQSEILAGRFAAGALLSETRIAEELGISRTPVGEAIRTLAAEGWVEQQPRRGTVVRSFSRREIIELYELREALETFAAAKAAVLVSDTVLMRLARYCDEMHTLGKQLAASGGGTLEGAELKRFLAADMAFHLLIVRTAGNSRIMKLVKQTRTISRLFRMRRQRHSLKVVERALEFHLRIGDALRAGDGPAAALAMAEHIQSSRRQTIDELDSQLALIDADAPIANELPADLVEALASIEDSGKYMY